ncbi:MULTISPECIES: alpha-L-fucosidase [Actinoalloteichus]|uniref:alpha-L-fucosidase n=1 Tax=Actinoalloteichus fjordicus TaxID=1612552 RepID=A0AAC9LDQ5_9PSEU|nr:MULTISPECIES: alpha-L-fucosidase [Actinoalloteichus]APU14429.1 Alpha-L-fucosidase [Actinoalloteichus fjordicus]APU20398.1 Alpha-L-fucosidase [Actinoalloteichus sp. GBA129-24]
MTAQPDARTDWFTEARFGLFVHWGLYSLAARHEWVKLREHLGDEHYDRYLEQFRADRYDPRRWAADAKAAGMRYAVLTSKHHEGFCLWDSALTEYKATSTPAARDLLAEFVAAFRAEGLRVGFYYSLIDWHHPDYPLDWMHPAFKTGVQPGGDLPSYVDYLHGQVRELITEHRPDILWFDFSFPEFPPEEGAPGKGRDDWQSARLVEMIRELDSDVLINDRLDLPGSADFRTPEEMAPHTDLRSGEHAMPWEACRTLNGSWGYAPSFQQWLDAGQVLRLLVDGVAKNGNLLLNVGPTGRGEFEPRARELLAEVGEWMRLHGDSVHGAGASTVTAPPDCRVTQSGDRVFVHLFSWPAGLLVVEGLAGRLRYASFLHDGAEVPFTEVRGWTPDVPHRVAPGPEGSVVLTLPARRPDSAVPVIELSLRS